MKMHETLLLFALLALGACSSEHEKEIEQLQPEGRTAVTLSMVTTKGESPSDEIAESKTFVYRRGPGDSEYLLTQIIDFEGESTRVIEFEDEDLTVNHSYRFLSYVRFSDSEFYKDTYWDEEYVRTSWHYLDGGSLKDLNNGIGKSTWADIRLWHSPEDFMVSTRFDKEHTQYDYYHVSESDGHSIKTKRKIEAKLTGMRGQFAIDFFKSSDGSIDNAIATSDEKSVLFAGGRDVYISGWYYLKTSDRFLFDGMKLEPDPEHSSWIGQEKQFYGSNIVTTAMFEGEESYPDWLVSGAKAGSERFYSPLLPPGEYRFELRFEDHNSPTETLWLKSPAPDAEDGLHVLSATRTILKVAIPGDRVWDSPWIGDLDFNLDWNDYN